MIRVGIDCTERTIEVHGIKYAMELFENMAFAPVGTWVRIVQRDYGTVTLMRPDPKTQAEIDRVAELGSGSK